MLRGLVFSNNRLLLFKNSMMLNKISGNSTNKDLLIIFSRKLQTTSKVKEPAVSSIASNTSNTSNRFAFNFSKSNNDNKNSNMDNIGNANSNNNTGKQLKLWSSYSLPSKETLLRQQEKQKEKQLAKQNDKSPISTSSVTKNKKSKRRLRPYKNLISLTPNAINHLKQLLNQPEPKLIRITVRNRGCSGLTYDLNYITHPGKFDEVVEQDGIKVIIDSKALFSIVGSEMDWIDDRLSSRFVFKNPNSKGTCGCGESFMV
ncbi:Fe-binding Fe/S cluster assembly protein ISA1 SCDLUD_001362 [Saccharomycodes ludwigii]|uniref:Fe-binding Fe/S cluster assembly protein ISA1 n=1 Tax=Saccharomycodes ludwigii TaxID=36035 RepID=UPI001E8BB453|nr:hypothetical protein SCDLUD_001362 [Saccharomycodes ludwigii]KAH3901598.1 hypothetical protein SCDLUD_001362 [Saccharomycodes ludwigii]